MRRSAFAILAKLLVTVCGFLLISVFSAELQAKCETRFVDDPAKLALLDLQEHIEELVQQHLFYGTPSLDYINVLKARELYLRLSLRNPEKDPTPKKGRSELEREINDTKQALEEKEGELEEAMDANTPDFAIIRDLEADITAYRDALKDLQARLARLNPRRRG